MPVESADDLAGFFDTDEFAEEFTVQQRLTSATFSGIYTDAPVTDRANDGTGSSAYIAAYEPRIICRQAAIADLMQGDIVTRSNGKQFQVINVQPKNDLYVIFLHDNW